MVREHEAERGNAHHIQAGLYASMFISYEQVASVQINYNNIEIVETMS